MIMMFIIAILLVFLGFRLYKKYGYKIVVSEVVWFMIPWCICLLLHFFGGIEYEYKLDIFSFLYILLFWACFLLGRKCALNRKINEKIHHFLSSKLHISIKTKSQNKKSNTGKINMFPFFILSLISGIGYLVFILANNDIVFGVTRNINTNFFGTFLLLLSNVSLIVWLYELAYSLLTDQKMPIYAYLSAPIYLISPLLISGRDAVIIFLLFTALVYFYCGRRGIQKYKVKGRIYKTLMRLAIVGISIVLIYFIFLSDNRYGNDMIGLFEWSTNSKFSDTNMYLYHALGSLGGFLINILYYYSSQFSKFAFIFQNYSGPYLGGLFQLHYLSRRFPESWHLSYTEVTTSAAKLMEAKGIPGMHSIWDTVIGYFIYDFGRILTPVFAFLAGYVVGKVRKNFKHNKSILSILYQVSICVAMFITVEFSPLFNTGWLFPLLWIVFIDKIYCNEKIRLFFKEVRK